MKRGICMKKMSKIIFPAAVIVVAASCAVVTSIHKPSTTVDINQERTSPTTSVQPLADFTNAASLCVLFEDMTNISAKTMDINKKKTTYIYDCPPDYTGVDSDIFAEFGMLLEKNGYEKIYEQYGTDYALVQYELLYDDVHLMVSTNCLPESISLDIVDYNLTE